MKIAKETWIIAAIGIADLLTTIVFIKQHGAVEANPLFRHFWEMGVFVFIAAKLIYLIGPLVVLEWARKRNPRFVSGALRTAIAGYVGFYCLGVSQLNAPRASASEMIQTNSGFSLQHEFLSLSSTGPDAHLVQVGDYEVDPKEFIQSFNKLHSLVHRRYIRQSMNPKPGMYSIALAPDIPCERVELSDN